ncbi:MAG TPA: HesA/MoeB/ThiF family protein [Planctomycetes bacterium]|nr:HesA/MoeB/ThiF family protein [Planctomycetota bacterium]
MKKRKPLTDLDRQLYQWQIWSEEFGEEGQEKLKNASVLISRVGGLGGVVAYELAAAGIGKLILAHPGVVRHPDLNRQLLMTRDAIGKPGVDIAAVRLQQLNPDIEIVAHDCKIDDDNAEELVLAADVIVDCAPMFEERFAMNRQAVSQGKPLVECAVYDFSAQITTVIPGEGPCVACLHPELPVEWKREFPVIGAVSGMLGCLGAVEAIKLLTGIGTPLVGSQIICELRSMTFRSVTVRRRPDCPICQA